MKRKEQIETLIKWYNTSVANRDGSIQQEVKEYYDGKVCVLNNVLFELFGVIILKVK